MNIFGGNTGMTYEDVRRKRKIAEALMAQKSAPRDVGEGIAAVGRAIMGRALEKRAERGEAELRDKFNEAFSKVAPNAQPMLDLYSNPMASDGQKKVLGALMKGGIPGFSNGGVSRGGLAVVGERGPEPVILPPGAEVLPPEVLDPSLMDDAQSPGMFFREDSRFNDGAAYRTADRSDLMPATMDDRIAEELDKKYVPDFLEWTAGGKSADAQKSIEQLREAYSTLTSGKNNLTGPVVGKVPDFIGTALNPEAIATRESIEEIVQRNLRLVLGAQFTEKEGERLIARAYNKQLQEPENAKRVERLLRAIETAAEARNSAAQYFQTNGTLVGWDGNLPTMGDIEAAVSASDKDGWQEINGVRIRVKK